MPVARCESIVRSDREQSRTEQSRTEQSRTETGPARRDYQLPSPAMGTWAGLFFPAALNSPALYCMVGLVVSSPAGLPHSVFLIVHAEDCPSPSGFDWLECYDTSSRSFMRYPLHRDAVGTNEHSRHARHCGKKLAEYARQSSTWTKKG